MEVQELNDFVTLFVTEWNEDQARRIMANFISTAFNQWKKEWIKQTSEIMWMKEWVKETLKSKEKIDIDKYMLTDTSDINF